MNIFTLLISALFSHLVGYAAVSTSVKRSAAPTATGIAKRFTVSDKVRSLFPESAKLQALTAKGKVRAGGTQKEGGMIPKRSVGQSRYESFTYTPLAISFTADAALNSTTQSVVSATGLVAPMSIVNTANGTTARIDSISGTDLTITSFGSTAFAVASGDVLLAMAPLYHEASKDPAIIHKDEDNIYNITFIARFPVSISASLKGDKSHTSQDFWSRLKENNVKEGLRRVENTLLFSNRPSSTNKNSGGTAFATSFGSTAGLFSSAGFSFDAGFQLTWSNFTTDIPQAFTTNTVADKQKMIMFVGNKTNGIMQGWVREKLAESQSGSLDKFGIKSKTFITDQFDVEVVRHDAFNHGAFRNQALLFSPDDIFYAFKKGRDLKPEKDIQSPSLDGFTDEFIGEIGMGTFDGWNSVMKITNIYNL